MITCSQLESCGVVAWAAVSEAIVSTTPQQLPAALGRKTASSGRRVGGGHRSLVVGFLHLIVHILNVHEPTVGVEDEDSALQHAPLLDQYPVAAPEHLGPSSAVLQASGADTLIPPAPTVAEALAH